MSDHDVLGELACYLLAGAPDDPQVLFDDVAEAERIGLGTGFISERFNVKEAATLSGAVAASSTDLGIATGVTNHNTRHLMVTASFATTMDRLTGGRFALGLGRGVGVLFDAFGIPHITTAQLEDVATLLRRVWSGELVLGHDGPAGRYPILHMDWGRTEPIPLLLSAFGPNSLALAGRVFDGVILHTYFSDETTARCVEIVRRAAEEAGRDPDAIRIWSCFATVGDHLPEALRLKKTVGRLATYLQGYGDLLVETNRWDPAALAAIRADPVFSSATGALDQVGTTEQLEHLAEVIPPEWLAAAATGTPDQCVDAVLGQLDLGCNGVILHGASPAELAPVVQAYRPRRPAGLERTPVNPGRPMSS
ncbi:MAG: TIGR03857 family LLM class F420-dependent oxidoreductase [Acidimicrobiales bacterium]